MKIVYITQTLPYPLDSGGHMKCYSTLKMLKDEGHEVILFSFVKKRSDLKYQKNIRKIGIKIGKIMVNPYLNPDNKNLILNLQNFFSLKPFTVNKFYDSEFFRSIVNYIRLNNIDSIWISYLSMSQYIPNTKVKHKIIELHDINSYFFRDMFWKDSFFKWKLFAFFEWLKFKHYENRQLKLFDKIYTLSQYDKDLIKKFVNNNKIKILPAKLSLKRIIHRKPKKNILIFIGNLNWYPNKDGINWFLKKIYPGLIKEIPKLKLKIIGKMPHENIYPRYNGIKFYGYQQNLDKFYKEATALIAPIRYGSGIRYKLLDALAANVPVISTQEGVKGLNKTYKDLYISVNDNDFYLNCKNVLQFYENKK